MRHVKSLTPAWRAACGLATSCLLVTTVPAFAQTTASPSATAGAGAAVVAAAPARPASGAAGGQGGGQRTRMACMAADRNHDGRISLEEFHQEVTRGWHALPQDASGHVVLAELGQIPGMDRRALERLKQADRDNDGRLSFKEVVAARMAVFDAADADSSDSISIDECVATERRMRARR